MNIVGFAIDDAALESDIARWAELGHGSSFQADDAKQLGAAIAKTLAAPFRVRDASGAIVGGGTVGGDAVPLEPGPYRVEILTDPPATRDIVVGVGEDVERQAGRSGALTERPRSGIVCPGRTPPARDGEDDT